MFRKINMEHTTVSDLEGFFWGNDTNAKKDDVADIGMEYQNNSDVNMMMREGTIDGDKDMAAFRDKILNCFKTIELVNPLALFRGSEAAMQYCNTNKRSFQDKAFLSTSSDFNVALRFMKENPNSDETCCVFHIHIPPSVVDLFVITGKGGHYEYEKEILLKPNTELQVITDQDTLKSIQAHMDYDELCDAKETFTCSFTGNSTPFGISTFKKIFETKYKTKTGTETEKHTVHIIPVTPVIHAVGGAISQRLVKTGEKVLALSRHRNVYVNKKKQKFIKMDGEFVLLSKCK
jgi:hypothetical protein